VEKTNIKIISSEALSAWCSEHSVPAFRIRQINDWLWKKGVRSFEEMRNLPQSFIALLQSSFYIGVVVVEVRQSSSDGTEKISFKLEDGAMVEGVLIPSGERTTACISTQAGCALCCAFCATGQAGFVRDALGWEIFDQVFSLNVMSLEKTGHKLNNIVFMGMGEPFLNYENTASSLRMLIDPEYGFGFSPQRITVSTSGIPEGIRRFAEDFPKVQLAVSLHSARQEKREELMPVAKKHSLEDLSAALVDYHNTTSGRIIIEYILLDNVNDSERDAHELARFCRSFPVKVNLICFNNIKESMFHSSGHEKTHTFVSILSEKNMLVQVRKSMGTDIDAACGQLAKKSNTNN